MYRKILSLMLCFALFGTFMTVNVSAADGAGVLTSQDFEDSEYMPFGEFYGNAEAVVVGNNTVVDMAADYHTEVKQSYIVDSSVTADERGSKYVVEFDLNVIDASGAFIVMFRNPDLYGKWYGINIFPASFGEFTNDSPSGIVNGGDGQWYNFRIAVDETKFSGTGFYAPKSCFTVKYKTVEAGEWSKLPCIDYGTYVEKVGFRPFTDGPHSHCSINPSNGYFAMGADSKAGNYFASMTPHYQVDNVTVFTENITTATSVKFEDMSGNILNDVSQDEIMATFNVENFGGVSKAKVVFAAFDKDGMMLRTEETPVNIQSGTGVASALFDVSDILGDMSDGRVEAQFLSENGEPLGDITGILGARGIVEKSETDADLGTDGESKTNGFSALDRSAVANNLIIEGAHSTGERATVVVKVTGNTSKNVIYTSLFNTKADGTFKKDIVLNNDLCKNDTLATVTVIATDTTTKTFEIPLFSNWDAMVADFADAEDMESYIETYLDNLTVYESGKTDATEADVEGIDYAEMAFIKSMNEYAEDMTYAEAVETVLDLIADTRTAEVFAEAFAEAQALETEAEQIEAIKALITECEIIEFSTVGASNVDAICKALIFSEATTLEGIYADFYVAYTNQKTAEEATVPGFTSIASGTEMKQFFVDNEIVLGVDPEKYSAEDYAVMYGVYEEKEYSTLASYEAVNEAIVFLDNYINEYNQFIALITNAATVEKNSETIKGLLNNNYTYIEIDLADESAVVNKEYLYARLIDMDCTSLDSIETAFSDAVAKQSAYETAAKDAFITIMDEASVKAYFAEYGDMLGTSEAKNYTDAELKVFVEVYNKFRPTARNYTEAKTQTEELIGKHKKATKFIADINKEAETKNWAGLKALYDGDVCSEFIGMDTATSEINDIRSMYMRIANNAPYGTLAEIETAWKNAYNDQDAYEEVAGGYETFDDEFKYFDDSAWKLSVQGNVIKVAGKVDALGVRYVTFHAESEGKIIYARQMKTEKDGSFELEFILNPTFYDAEAQGVLRVGGDMINIYEFSPFELYSEEELQGMVDAFLEIDNKNELKAFIDEYSDELNIEVDTANDRIMEAMTFVYLRDKKAGKYDEISDIPEILNGTSGNGGMLSIMLEMQKMIDCLDELTEAANKEFGNTVGQWAKIKDQVRLAVKNEWISPKVSGKISNESSMYLRMAGKDYEYMSEVENEYENAHKAQYDSEKKTNDKQNSGGGGGGGGSAVNGSKLPITSGNGAEAGNEEVINMGTTPSTEKELDTNLESHPEAPFKDVTSDYSWAKDSIDRLRRYNLISGDGTGNFRPGKGISREEFLKILLNVFAIDVDKNASVSFGDVDKNGWYYGYVATAYEMGIIKGYTDTEFGIGDVVTRADMAVMVMRTMDMMKIELKATDRALAFNDYDKIPEYAYHSVTRLQQAGILNGDSFGNFNGSNGLNRAEAAVVFATLFNDMNDFITYSWEKVY